MKKLGLTTLISLFCVLNLSCSEKTIDKIGDAQKCLDDYAQQGGDVDTCESKIEGVETPAAYGIRCAAGYIREGFTAQTFTSAFEDIETVDATTVESFLNAMTFDGASGAGSAKIDADFMNASTVYDNCHASLGKGATVLATFTYLINGIYKLACDGAVGCGYGNNTNFLGGLALGRLGMTAAASTFRSNLGAVVVKTHALSCGSSVANKTLCDFLNRAITNASPSTNEEIGREFLVVITTP